MKSIRFFPSSLLVLTQIKRKIEGHSSFIYVRPKSAGTDLTVSTRDSETERETGLITTRIGKERMGTV